MPIRLCLHVHFLNCTSRCDMIGFMRFQRISMKYTLLSLSPTVIQHMCTTIYKGSIYPRIEVYPLCGCIGSINFCICRNIHVTLLYGVLGFTHMSYLTSKISISLFFSNTMQRMCSLSSTLSRSSEKTCLIDHFLFSARSIFLLDFQVIFLYTPFFYTIASSSVLLI
jgi:hypothetical protein